MRRFVGALAACAAVAAAAAATTGAGRLPAPVATAEPASPVQCGPARDAIAAYGWPIEPFNRQHPIRGAFGDPRTVERSSQPLDGPQSTGSFQFHKGIDIVAEDGTPVYPVESGIAVVKHTHEVSVHTPGGRVFQYWHLHVLVHTGDRVVAGTTVLGTIQRGAHHVHLGEIAGLRVVNPLAPGHIGPYRDNDVPVVKSLLARTPTGSHLPVDDLHGRAMLIVDAFDKQSLRFWGPWSNKPVAPALIRWRLVPESAPLLGSRPVPAQWRVAVDFRRREPRPRLFWQTYAVGTYQNFPVLDDKFHWDMPGRYLFRLTREPIDTRALPDGRYRVEVQADDICGNRGTLAVSVRILNRGL